MTAAFPPGVATPGPTVGAVRRCAASRLRRLPGLAVTLAAFMLFAGCSQETETDPPAELTDIVARHEVARLWNVGLGSDAEHLRLALRPAVVDGVVYAASHKGDVAAFAADSGRRVWNVRTRLPLSAGPAVRDGLVALGSSDGDVLVLDAATGEERWRTAVSSEVLATPEIARGMVIVRTVDGRIEALDARNGSLRWAVEEQVPRLTLRGTAPPVMAGDVLIAAFDNGKVLAVDTRTGETLWDSIVNVPSGRTELERLADIDARPHVIGDDVYVVGFQGRMAMLALDSGQIWWARDVSSYRGFALDEQNIYLTNADGVVIAMRRRDGATQWEQNALLRRGLTAPTIDGDTLVVGDFEGYLHWLDKHTGEIVARQKTGGERLTNAAVAVDGRVFVQTDAGKLLAYRSGPEPERTADSQ